MSRKSSLERTSNNATLARTKRNATLTRTAEDATLSRTVNNATLSITERNVGAFSFKTPGTPRIFILVQNGGLLLDQVGVQMVKEGT